MSPITDDEAIGRTFVLAMKSRLVIGLLGLCVGGSGGTYLSGSRTDPRIDTIMTDLKEMKPVVSLIHPIQDTLRGLGGRVADIELWRDRQAYLAPRKQTIGRGRE